MKTMKKLPIGIEHFEEMRREDFYYVDKTGMIKELLENKAKVNLFTRPRRFGKSLNMSLKALQLQKRTNSARKIWGNSRWFLSR